MARKKRDGNFEEMLDELRGHGFEVTPDGCAPGGMRATKAGVAAVVVPGVTDDRWDSGGRAAGGDAGAGGAGVRLRGCWTGDTRSLLRLPNMNCRRRQSQLQAIHAFTEELNQLTGALGLYNESLGTTSDLYLYDRLKGREAEPEQAARPRELGDGH